MSNIVNPLVEEYIRALLPPNNPLLTDMEEFAKQNHVPIVQPEVAKFLEVITKISGAKHILEVGTAIGYSGLIFVNAMDSGKLVSIERRKDMIERAKNYRALADKDGDFQIIEGDATEILPTLKGEFDLIFLDAAKGQYSEFLSSCINLLKDGGILVSDNVLYKGMVASNQYVIRRKKTIVKRMRTYLDYIMDHPELTTSLLPIGDGVALSYKNKEAKK